MKILNHFQHVNLTSDQRNALVQLQSFLESDKRVFIPQGYAGSGKTNLLKGFVTNIKKILNNTFGLDQTEEDCVDLEKMKDRIYYNVELMSFSVLITQRTIFKINLMRKLIASCSILSIPNWSFITSSLNTEQIQCLN